MTAADRYPKTVVLTDGAHLTLRLAADAARRGLAGDAAAAPAADLVVLACDGVRVAGELRLRRAADAATVTVALDPAYRGRRLGTWLLLDAVHAAEHFGVDRLIAEVGEGDRDLAAALVRLDFHDDAPPAGGHGARRLIKRIHRGWTDF